MPASESERESFSRLESDHYLKESDDYGSTRSVQLPNGSIGHFNDIKYNFNSEQYSTPEKYFNLSSHFFF